MCGICGYLSKRIITEHELSVMNDTMKERGPDDSGTQLWELPGELADQVKTRNFGAGLNFGAGVELISHLQVGFNYALGLTDNYSVETPSLSKSDGKNRGWSVTAAILF